MPLIHSRNHGVYTRGGVAKRLEVSARGLNFLPAGGRFASTHKVAMQHGVCKDDIRTRTMTMYLYHENNSDLNLGVVFQTC